MVVWRSLQMACDAFQRRRGEILHRRRQRLGEVSRLRTHGAGHPAHSALPLDASRTETILRHQQTPRRIHREGNLGRREQETREDAGARDSGIEQRRRRLHHR